jgi:PhzF family phenazine biosynthesis protein
MKLKIYQVDAFTDTLFSGNPAAVVPLEQWPDESLMQKIAAENNLAETVFYVKEGERYLIRWFTPTVEVDLCGHATLAAAFILFHQGDHDGDLIHFHSHRSGALSVSRTADKLRLDFPADTLVPVELTKELLAGFSIQARLAFKGKTDYMFVFGEEDEIRDLKPDFSVISKWNVRGVIATARGKRTDFVSRFFAPQSGINEDPVTGSAHTSLTPYWTRELGKTELSAMQLSERTGYLECRQEKDRVLITGTCRLYLEGSIFTGA